MTKQNGWTQNDAEDRVRLRHMANPHSLAKDSVEFDVRWGECVIVTQYPGAPTTLERKSRQGLQDVFRVKVETAR